jgi:hypothetical protein
MELASITISTFHLTAYDENLNLNGVFGLTTESFHPEHKLIYSCYCIFPAPA